MHVSTLLSVTSGIDGAYRVMCRPMLEEFHLQQIPFDILMCLKNHPKVYTAAQISGLRHLKPSVVSHYVEFLVKEGLLCRQAVNGDRRKVRLRLTEKAEPIVVRGQELQLDFYRTMTRGLSEEELQIFRHCVHIAGKNADAIRGGSLGIEDVEEDLC